MASINDSNEEVEIYNKLENNQDIYNIICNYDINKLFDKLSIPITKKDQLKSDLIKALKEKDTDAALRILNYIPKYKHNFYRKNDILLEDNNPSEKEKDITLKDSGIYEIIFEGASQKSAWYSSSKGFEHFLVEASPWYDSVNHKIEEVKKYLFLLKNFNYLLVIMTDNNVYNAYIGDYELNDKGCFLFKKYKSDINIDQLLSLNSTFSDLSISSYEQIELRISALVEEYNFSTLKDNDLLDYFEYNSSAFAAYGTRQILLEINKSPLYSSLNDDSKVFLKGSGSGKGDIDLIDFKNSIVLDDIKDWVTSEDKSYEKREYYLNYVQTKNVAPMGDSSYLSKIISVGSNYKVKYNLMGFDSDINSSIILDDQIYINKPDIKLASNFDRNNDLSPKEDHKYVGHYIDFDYDENNLNSESSEGFVGGGRKGYGPHMNHQGVCYWNHGDDARIRIRYLGDENSIMKRVFFPNDSHKAGKRISLKGNKSPIEGYDYIDVPSSAIIEFKYKCSGVGKSLNFNKCFATILKNSSSVFDEYYASYGYESELDQRTVSAKVLNSLIKGLDLFSNNIEKTVTIDDIYSVIDTEENRWTMGDLFFNNSYILKDSLEFLNFKIDKDWNYYTISFRVFDNMILDFGHIEDEVDFYNSITLEGLEGFCEELESNPEYFNKSNVHGEDTIKSITLKDGLQDRIIDDNLNSLYNKNYYNSIVFNSNKSSGTSIITEIIDLEDNSSSRKTRCHDYRIFCEQFEKIYVTIKSGNQIDLKPINKNIDFGDYELEKSAYITNFNFKRTFFSKEELYERRISVKQGEFIYFKCEFNSCRIEIDKELSSFPEDTIIYPVNFDPFNDKFYSLNHNDYTNNSSKDYTGYEKGTVGTTFQWVRFTTSNSSCDIIVFLKKLTIKISFLNDLFGQDLITKNYDNNYFEPNEAFSFYVYVPHNCRISTYKYSNKMTYSYVENDLDTKAYCFNEDCYESFISFYSGNSKKILLNFKDYIFSMPDALGSYSGTRNLYELFRSSFTSIDKKINYYSDDSVIFTLVAKYSDTDIRISEDYVVGSQVFENFTGSHNDRLLTSGLYRFVATSGNTGNGGDGGEIVPNDIYSTLISGNGGGGLYGGSSGQSHRNNRLSPIDTVHYMWDFTFKIYIGTREIHLTKHIYIPAISILDKSSTVHKNWSFGNSTGTLGLTMFMGVGSGIGGNGFYKEGHTAGDGAWFLEGLKDELVDGSMEPLKESYLESDSEWTLNSIFSNNLDSQDYKNQKKYYLECFSSQKNITNSGQLIGTNYLDNNFNERYRGTFFDAIVNVGSSENNKIMITSKVGSSGKNGLSGRSSNIDAYGNLISLPRNGVCGQEGQPTTLELDNESFYHIVDGSYFTNIKDDIIGEKSLRLNKLLLCAGIHDTSPQKSFDIPGNWTYGGHVINDYLRHYTSESGPKVSYYGQNGNLSGRSADKNLWKNMNVHSFQGGDLYNKYHIVPKRDATFGSFSYIQFQWMWIEIELTFTLATWLDLPLKFDLTKGFYYIIHDQSFRRKNVISVKYRPKLFNLAWDTMTHTIYTVSDSDSKLSSDDFADDKFIAYSPSEYIEIDNNSHFQAQYPFAWQNSSYSSDDSLNSYFKDGNKYKQSIKKNLYSYVECYKNFKRSDSIWNNVYNVYKNNILCVSNIGLSKKVEGGSILQGRLLSLKENQFNNSNPQFKNYSFSLSKVDIKSGLVYRCNFNIGTHNLELPINGLDSKMVSTLKNIFDGNELSLYNSDLSTVLIKGIPSKIVYTSELFSKQSYSNTAFNAEVLNYSDKSIFRNNESHMAIYKFTKKEKTSYAISAVGNFNKEKFFIELKNNSQYGKVLYNSILSTKNVVTLNIPAESYSLLTSYDSIITKKGNDFYVIMYDNNNSLFNYINKNSLSMVSYDRKVALNYYLEYSSSRGRIPLISDSLFEAIFLGRDPDKLNDDDKANHKIAYVYGGALFQDGSNNIVSSKDISYDSLSSIDDTSDYTIMIDYKNICNGNAILNSSQSDWLKI